MQRNHLHKMVINNFLSKTKLRQLGNYLFLIFFSIINFFHVFLVNVLNIISVVKKEICTYFTKKNSKVELNLSNTFFWWPSSNFAIFFVK